MANTRFPSFLRVAGSSSPPAANPQVERMIGVSDPYRGSKTPITLVTCGFGMADPPVRSARIALLERP